MSSKKTGWESVSPEVLGLVFVRLPAEERIATVALVCRAWLEAVYGPYTWTEIDIDAWGRRRVRSTDVVDSAVRKLVRRSKCGFRRLSACRIGDSGFSYAANCARFLKVLQIPMSMVTDNMVKKHAESLSNLTTLDISYCSNITTKGIEAFGKHCKCLVHLTRSMSPLDPQSVPYDDSEAISIADTMTGLRQLDLCYGRFGNSGLSAILTNCKELTHLHVLGCWNLEFEDGIIEKSHKLVQFVSPWSDSELVSDDGVDEEEEEDNDDSDDDKDVAS